MKENVEHIQKKNSFLKKATTDLFTINISTIICDNISAEDMPKPSIAIRQVAQAYCNTLQNYNKNLKIDLNISEDEEITVFSKISQTIDEEFKTDTFTSLQEKDASHKSFWFILYRIKQISDQLNIALSGKSLKNCDCDQEMCIELVALLRKAWEIGVEEIALNTVMSIDGDVITRINRNFVGSESSCLHAIHHQSINVCLQWWKELFGILNNFVNNLFSFTKK